MSSCPTSRPTTPSAGRREAVADPAHDQDRLDGRTGTDLLGPQELVDGEVAGTWRYRRGDHEVTITSFTGLTPAQRTKAERSADLVAEATGDDQPAVAWV
jgi:hypothetical protein